MNRRATWLYGTLAATVAATAGMALQPDGESAPVAAAQPLDRVARRAPAASSAPPATAHARPRRWTVPDERALAAWSPPPAPAAPPPPRAASANAGPPPAPAFPYKWIGRLVPDGQGPIALLDGPQRSVGAVAGEVLDGQWRIDRVGEERIDVTWLPAEQRLSVPAR